MTTTTQTDWREGRRTTETFLKSRFEHCRTRMWERFQQTMTYHEWESLNENIFREEDSTYVDVGDTDSSSLHLVFFKTQSILVAYSDTALCMMTIFPRTDKRRLAALNGTVERKGLCDAQAVQHVARTIGFGLNETAATAKPFAHLLEVSKPEENLDAVFANLSRTIDAKTAAISSVADRIAELEARLASLKQQEETTSLSCRLLSGAREMAGAVYDQHRAGLIKSEEAAETVQGLLRTVTAVSVDVSPVEATEPPLEEAIALPPPEEAHKTVRERLLSGETVANIVRTTSLGNREATQLRNSLIFELVESGETCISVAKRFGLEPKRVYQICWLKRNAA